MLAAQLGGIPPASPARSATGTSEAGVRTPGSILRAAAASMDGSSQLSIPSAALGTQVSSSQQVLLCRNTCIAASVFLHALPSQSRCKTHLASVGPPNQMQPPPQDQGLIGNYHNHVQINSKLQPIAERLGLKRMVPVAVDRAVADIITPVVERSVTIACMTTQELVLKVKQKSSYYLLLGMGNRLA